MKAVVQHRYGPPERVLQLTEADRPQPGPDDALVRVRATSVNTPDWIAVTGTPYVIRTQFGLRRPKHPIRGSDLAGVVEAVGDNVTDLAPGDEVFGSLWTGDFSVPGSFAEYAVAPAAQLARKPPGIGFAEAAASVMSGLTALAAIRETRVAGPGKRVLINGASGGVGTFAVQFAAHLGADVTAVCGPSNTELVRTLGAARAIDYTRTDFTAGTERYDLILDNVLNRPPRRTTRLLAPGGMFIPNSAGAKGRVVGALGNMAAAFFLKAGRRNIRFVSCAYERRHLEDIAELIESGEVKVILDSTHPLERAGTAVATMLGHHARGNVAITVD